MSRPKGSKNAPRFKVTVIANGKEYSAKGLTILAALTKTKVEPVRIGVAILRVEYGEKKFERIIGRLKAMQLFNRDGSPTIKGIVQNQLAKYLESAFT